MIKKIKALQSRIAKNDDHRALVSNFGYITLLQIAGYIFPLLTIPYLARVIGVEGFGKIAFAAAVVVWLQTFVDWGFNYTATRDLARERHNPERVAEIFSNVMWARIFLTFVSLALLTAAVLIVPYFKENLAILYISFLLIPGHVFFPEWFFQAMEKMKFITIFSLLIKVVFTILVFLFIKEKSDFILQPLFVSLGYLISGAVAMYLIVVRWEVKVLPPHLPSVYASIRGSTDVFLNNILPNLYNSLTVVLMGFWGGAVANGIYDAGRRFVLIAHSFMGVFIRVTFPFLSRNLDKHEVFARYYLAVAACGAALLFMSAPLIIKIFFTIDFEGAVTVLQISSASIFLVALSRIYGTNYLIIKGYERDLRNITFVSSLIGFSIAMPLVYFWSYVGAALTMVVTQAILGLTVMLKARAVKKTCL